MAWNILKETPTYYVLFAKISLKVTNKVLITNEFHNYFHIGHEPAVAIFFNENTLSEITFNMHCTIECIMYIEQDMSHIIHN